MRLDPDERPVAPWPGLRVLRVRVPRIGLTLGLVTQPLILVTVFLVLICPVALVFKLIGRDTMKRKLDKSATSYWEEYKETDDPATYVKQF